MVRILFREVQLAHTLDLILVLSLQPGVCEILKKIGTMEALRDSTLDMALYYMAYYCSRVVDWTQCVSLWLLFDFRMGNRSDILSCSVPSTRHRTADVEPPTD